MGVDISVILPAYDEAENLPVVVGEVFAVFDAYTLDGEVVVVDDGSGDRSHGLYDWVAAGVTGVEGRDMNSGLKAMRRDVALDLDLHGELHRYIPVLTHWAGYRTGEIDVHDRRRLHGRGKFGRARFWRGMLDLATVKLLTTYTARPLRRPVLSAGVLLVVAVQLFSIGLLAELVVHTRRPQPLGSLMRRSD